MAKPANGATLNTGHALYTSLAAVWAMLEGSGGTTADLTGSHNLTLGDSAVWTTIGGEAAISIPSPAGLTAQPLAVASPFTLSAASPWSIAWRGKESADNGAGMTIGDKDDTSNFVWMSGNNDFLRFRSSNTTDHDFALSLFTTDANYLLAWDQAGDGKVHLYKDGSQVGTGVASTTSNAGLSIDTVGNAYSGQNFALNGTLTYCYVWSGRALNSTDASTLHSDPYVFLSAGTPTAPLTQSTVHSAARVRACNY